MSSVWEVIAELHVERRPEDLNRALGLPADDDDTRVEAKVESNGRVALVFPDPRAAAGDGRAERRRGQRSAGAEAEGVKLRLAHVSKRCAPQDPVTRRHDDVVVDRLGEVERP